MRSWLALLPVAFLLSCGNAAKLNVLLVTLDTTRADYFSSYGHPWATTPHFDRIGRDGARFDLAMSQASVTPVSHAGILSGLYPQNHGVRVMYAASGYRLPDHVPTLPSLLQEHGWETGAFLSAFPVSEHFGFDRGFDHWDNGLDGATPEMKLDGEGRYAWGVRDNQRRSDVTTDRALAWLGETKDPFFAWIHYWDPHDGGLFPPHDRMNAFLPRGLEGDDLKRGIYAAEVNYVDTQFGRIVQWLEESEQWDNTIVVVVADHGEGLGDHDWWHHRILYQEQIRVPLLVRVPGIPASPTVEPLVRTIDIFPTVLEAVDLTPPTRIDGETLSGLMQGETGEGRIAYADQLNLYDTNANVAKKRPRDAILHCAMDDQWKLIYRPREPENSELYDLKADPGELTNQYAADHPQARRLLAELQAADGWVDGPFGDEPNPEVLERLKALGYID